MRARKEGRRESVCLRVTFFQDLRAERLRRGETVCSFSLCFFYLETPAELRAFIVAQGWQRIVGFQTRNPLHRSHLELTLRAANAVDGHLLIHPSVGMFSFFYYVFVLWLRCRFCLSPSPLSCLASPLLPSPSVISSILFLSLLHTL